MQKRQSPGLVSDGTNTDGVKETDVNTQFRSRDPVKMALSVGSHPTLMAYLRRVGATERNFRKHVIVVADEYAYMGGKREIATIKMKKMEPSTATSRTTSQQPTSRRRLRPKSVPRRSRSLSTPEKPWCRRN